MKPYIWMALFLWAAALASLYVFIEGGPEGGPQVVEPAAAGDLESPSN